MWLAPPDSPGRWFVRYVFVNGSYSWWIVPVGKNEGRPPRARALGKWKRWTRACRERNLSLLHKPPKACRLAHYRRGNRLGKRVSTQQQSRPIDLHFRLYTKSYGSSVLGTSLRCIRTWNESHPLGFASSRALFRCGPTEYAHPISGARLDITPSCQIRSLKLQYWIV